MPESHRRRIETLAVTAGEHPTPEEGAGDVVSPIHLASTFALPGLDTDLRLDDIDPDRGEFVYSRLSNPTRHAAEKRLAALEGGETAYAFGSGTAATLTAVLSMTEAGDHVVAGDDLYAGTRRMFEEVFADRLAIEVSFVDATDVEAVQSAIREDTTFIWMESPTNPRMGVCDIAAIADIAAESGVTFGVDNTFASPIIQRPLSLGADLVVHSTTKYLNGHSDSLGGAVVTDDPAVAESIEFLQQVGMGNVMAPFDSYLLLRGTKTLPLRMERHQDNAMAIAEFLEDHPRVETVYYPGLASHPQHDLASRQMDGYGGILSFELDGEMADAKAFLEALDDFTLAVSLGGVESLIELPAAMTHEPISAEERAALGITDTLIRVSVGIENKEDLVADLSRGFDAIS